MRDILASSTEQRKPIFIPPELAGDMEEESSDHPPGMSSSHAFTIMMVYLKHAPSTDAPLKKAHDTEGPFSNMGS
jgi:hypothetical protein